MKKSLQHLQSWYGCYCMLLLILIIVILLGMRNTNNNSCYQNGRYQIAGNYRNTCWVIDTETSQLWLRTTRGGYELGTNSYPRNVKMIEKSGLLSDLVPVGSYETRKLK